LSAVPYQQAVACLLVREYGEAMASCWNKAKRR
jgi:hypothetical protein